jgi:hypothetical protein
MLQSLEFDTRAQIQKIMEEPGRPSDDDGNGLHYDSDNNSFGGVVNFSFTAGKVTLINALISQDNSENLEYIWNSKLHFFCSDLPESNAPCSGPDAVPTPNFGDNQ